MPTRSWVANPTSFHNFLRAEGIFMDSLMNEQFSKFRMNFVLRLLTVFALLLSIQAIWAQQEKAGADSPQAAWSSIQQLVDNLDAAVKSKNLHGIHEPSMKIRAPIRTLKQHSTMLSGEAGQKMTAALKQLDTAITDLHSAADEGNQKEAESAVKEVDAALGQLKSQDPDAAFKAMH